MNVNTYPISQLIYRIQEESGLGRVEFVQSLGYRNATKGLRRLDHWLDHGKGDESFLQSVVNTYHPDAAALQTALADTGKIHQRERDEARQRAETRSRQIFKPCIWVETEEGPHSMISAMAEQSIKVLDLGSKFKNLSHPQQLELVQRRIRKHCRKAGGQTGPFGAILRYRYLDTFDTSIMLDTAGNVVEEHGGQFLLPDAYFELG